MKIVLTNMALICALGESNEKIVANATQNPLKGMVKLTNFAPDKETIFGQVSSELPQADIRANALILKALETLKVPDYPADRIGVVLGSSNTGIEEAQNNINEWLEVGKAPKAFSFDQLKLGTPALFLKNKLGIQGPAFTISTACSSSAKAFVSARRLIENDICDCVIVGGVDSKCTFAINGFEALEALSHTQTNPMSQNRQGINLGEGVALFVMEKDKDGIELKGVGETSDAYHLTAPDPTGAGAIEAMTLALKQAHLTPTDIDYINLHGTGTGHNDAMEASAVWQVFKDAPYCSSTKPMTGHTLGASGAIELALCYLMLQNDVIFPHVFDGQKDEALKPIKVALKPEKKTIKNILSNSFAFGGSNVSVIIGK